MIEKMISSIHFTNFLVFIFCYAIRLADQTALRVLISCTNIKKKWFFLSVQRIKPLDGFCLLRLFTVHSLPFTKHYPASYCGFTKTQNFASLLSIATACRL